MADIVTSIAWNGGQPPVDRTDALKGIVEKYAQPDPSTTSTLPKGGVQLTYMGHAEVTLALIDIDPFWSWEPLAKTPEGLPLIINENRRLVLWMYLTVLGKRILGVGTCEAGKGDPEKELIGDGLRNCAMRAGIGTKLWSKAGHSADPFSTAADTPVRRSQGRTAPSQMPPGPAGELTPAQVLAQAWPQLTPAQKQAAIAVQHELGVSNIMRAGEHATAILTAIGAAGALTEGTGQ